MNSSEVKTSVQSFRERTAHGIRIEHCFAPWFLHQQYRVSETKAIEQSSDGAYDFGIDGFHLYTENGSAHNTNLVLVQAKHTEGRNKIAEGYEDLARCLPQLHKALQGHESDAPIENNVLVRLRAALNGLGQEVRAKLHLDFVVLHLSDEDSDIVGNYTHHAREKLRDAIENELPNHICTIRLVSPRELGSVQEVIAPAEYSELSLTCLGELSIGDGTCMYTGVGRLADLVSLYQLRRNHLFSKNVRYYLYTQRNHEKGAAGKMRETLKGICVTRKLAPELFALFHNGVTLYAKRVESTGHGVRIREPFVLNGCQTIKNAFFFLNDANLKNKIDEGLWMRVAVPIRIIQTSSEELVRTITINNNRQNAMAVSAFRANDPVQMELEERFRQAGIFYERQEGAFKNVERRSPEELSKDYLNSRGRCVGIVNLARCLAAAAGKIRLAERPSDIFESDTAYKDLFDRTYQASVPFLVFLQNLDDVMSVILKKDLNLTQKGTGPNPARLKYYAICLCLRYITKNKRLDCVSTFGTTLFGSKSTEFRDEVARLMG